MAWKHRLSNIDAKLMVGDCEYCGPEVRLMYDNYEKRIRCWTGRQKGGTYGIVVLTYEDKKELWDQEQDRRCKICYRPIDYFAAVLDHCHDTDRLRNFLCNDCNLSIGKFGDSVEVLQRAIDYLTDESKWLKHGQQG